MKFRKSCCFYLSDYSYPQNELLISYKYLILIPIYTAKQSFYHILKYIYYLTRKRVINQNNIDFSNIDK
jgi:hypothetical protein